MSRHLRAFGATAVAFCAIDFVWLAIVAPGFYQGEIGSLLLAAPRLAPALVFYVLYVSGLVFFCVAPALAAMSARMAALRGAFFGLVAYGTYDLSNLATLKEWTIPVTLVDISWGAILSALASACGYLAARPATRHPS